jgi:hypothetical protein
MKRIFLNLSLIILLNTPEIFSQVSSGAEVYLITCGPGTETYSLYGHSALRIVMQENQSDIVYNWGIFDFSTPNFAWKFAKGRLDYILGTESFQSFLQGYFHEQRYVYSQKINLEPEETEKLLGLIAENLRPENIKYRYDFFYDDCSTRIRDLLEKTIGKDLLYPPGEKGEMPTFRELVGKYQSTKPWLNFGINLIMGSTADKKAIFRDRMFLPVDMMNGLSESVIRREGKMIPLLQNPARILDFDYSSVRPKFYYSPVFIFTLLFILIAIISPLIKTARINKLIDYFIYSVFSILAILMLFFNFFTDHQQMRWNLNILWLNPFIIFCLISLICKKDGLTWYRIVFYISVGFLLIHLFLPQKFDTSVILLTIILLIRSSMRARFEWNPLSV